MRKGQYDIGRKTLYFIVVLFFVTFVFLYLKAVIDDSNNELFLRLHKAKAEIILQQLSTSPDCFAYYDQELARPYPGIIDSEKFLLERLKCVRFYSAFNVELRGDKTLNLSQTEFKAIHSVERPVLIRKNGGLEKGTLFVEVANV
ncbi:MAG: hypothetical protein ABIB71_07165 [Candidatus Woesearchaeota archaeon]